MNKVNETNKGMETDKDNENETAVKAGEIQSKLFEAMQLLKGLPEDEAAKMIKAGAQMIGVPLSEVERTVMDVLNGQVPLRETDSWFYRAALKDGNAGMAHALSEIAMPAQKCEVCGTGMENHDRKKKR